MSAQYDLYETPDIKQTGEKQPLHPALFPKGLSVRTNFWTACTNLRESAVVCWQEQCSLFKMS